MKLFRHLKELKILLFWEIIATQNPLLLDKDYSEDKIYSPMDIAESKYVWIELYDEYFLLENDAVVKAVLRENLEILRTLNVINHLGECVNYLMMLCNTSNLMTDETYDESVQMVYSAIKKTEPRVNINYFGKVQKNIDATVRVMNSLNNSFQIKHKRNQKDVENQKANVFKQVADVTDALGIQISVHGMYVPEWVAYKQLAKSKNRKSISTDGK